MLNITLAIAVVLSNVDGTLVAPSATAVHADALGSIATYSLAAKVEGTRFPRL